MKYARIIDNVAIETFVPQDGFTIADSFHPDIAAQFVEVPNEVTANSTKNPDGTWEIFVYTDIPYVAPQLAEGEVQDAPDVSA
jgi:hypothetical protein